MTIAKIILLLTAAFLIVGCGKQVRPKNPFYHDKSQDVKPLVNGKISGLVRYYRYNGTLMETREYLNGKKHGENRTYDRDGNLWYFGNYKDNELHGIEKRYAIENKKVFLYKTTTYKNGKKHGVAKEYRTNGKPRTVESYINGKLDGKATYYHTNGKIMGKEMYKNGNLEGTSTFYHSNGKVHYINKYDQNGKLHGVKKHWYDDGSFQSSVTYKHGIKHGPYLEHVYAFNEKTIYKGKYINGEEHPIVTHSQKRDNDKLQKSKTKAKSYSVSLKCSYGGSKSMSQAQRDNAIAQGKGEGAALGYMMSHQNSRPASANDARNYCTNQANTHGMNCDEANTYLSACIRKFGY